MAKKIIIIMSDYNKTVTKKMLSVATATAKRLGLQVAETVRVPGALEIPFAMKRMAERKNGSARKNAKDFDGIVALGAVIWGDTDHDMVVAHNCATMALKISVKHNIPLGFGVMGPRVRLPQAEKKAEEYSRRAVETVAKMMGLFGNGN